MFLALLKHSLSAKKNVCFYSGSDSACPKEEEIEKISLTEIKKFEDIRVERRQPLYIYFTTNMKNNNEMIYLDFSKTGTNISLHLFGVNGVKEIGIQNTSIPNIIWFASKDLKIFISGSSRLSIRSVYLTNTHFYNSTGALKHIVVNRVFRTDFDSIKDYKYLGASSRIEINLPEKIDQDFNFRIFARSQPARSGRTPPQPQPSPGGDIPNRTAPQRLHNFRLVFRNPQQHMNVKVWGSEYTLSYDNNHKAVFSVVEQIIMLNLHQTRQASTQQYITSMEEPQTIRSHLISEITLY